MKQRFSPDTDKQQIVSHALARGGFTAGWRVWVQQQRASGRSAQAIAFDLKEYTGIALDQSTLNLWIKQAGARGQGSEVSDDTQPDTPDEALKIA